MGNIVLSLLVSAIFSHNAAFFILLDYKVCFRLLEKVNYIPQTILITLAITFTILNATRSKKVKKFHPTVSSSTDMTDTSSDEKIIKKE